MTMKAPIAVLAIATLALAGGCGGGNDDTTSGADSGTGGVYGGTGSAANTTAEPASGAVVSVASVPGLGQVVVDSRGLTLYDFHKDKGTESSCYGGCAEVWPPLITNGEPQPSNGASAAKLGTTERKDGTTQVTYAGHPLYTYVSDEKPGDAKGNDIDSFGAEWYALTPRGTEPED